MRLPFTTRQEICDLAARYSEEQREDRQDLEREVIGFKESVRSRGYLLEEELRKMGGDWMRTPFFSSKIDTPEVIHKITREAFGLADDWEKLLKLTEIGGVGKVVASGILHLYDEGCYPVFSEVARRVCDIDQTTEPNWREYVATCRAASERYDVSMRKLDRALYKCGGGNNP